MIGLCGAHRTGKTTLARQFAERHGIPFIETSVSAVFARMGYDPKADYDFATRLLIQHEILRDTEEKYRAQAGVFVTDRTPIDMLGYTLADVTRANLTADEIRLLHKYEAACIDATNRFFSILLLVQPGIPLVDDPTKAPINTAYMAHLNSLMFGLCVDERITAQHFYIPRTYLDMDERLDCLEFAYKRGRLKAAAERAEAVLH